MIEQVRTAVTDEQGRDRILNLRPGTYSVTFTLVGFHIAVREGITLEADFAATIDARMPVTEFKETLTVTGSSPVVDVHSTNRREVLSRK